MIADIEELEEMDASELLVRRLNAKEVVSSMKVMTILYFQLQMALSQTLEEIDI